MEKRRVVITGMGAVTPLGHTVQETWDAVRAGACGIAPITLFGRLPGFPGGMAQGGDRAQAGDNYSSFFHSSFLSAAQTAIPPSTHSTWPVT